MSELRAEGKGQSTIYWIKQDFRLGGLGRNFEGGGFPQLCWQELGKVLSALKKDSYNDDVVDKVLPAYHSKPYCLIGQHGEGFVTTAGGWYDETTYGGTFENGFFVHMDGKKTSLDQFCRTPAHGKNPNEDICFFDCGFEGDISDVLGKNPSYKVKVIDLHGKHELAYNFSD